MNASFLILTLPTNKNHFRFLLRHPPIANAHSLATITKYEVYRVAAEISLATARGAAEVPGLLT